MAEGCEEGKAEGAEAEAKASLLGCAPHVRLEFTSAAVGGALLVHVVGASRASVSEASMAMVPPMRRALAGCNANPSSPAGPPLLGRGWGAHVVLLLVLSAGNGRAIDGRDERAPLFEWGDEVEGVGRATDTAVPWKTQPRTV